MKTQNVDGASYTLTDDRLLYEAFGEKKVYPLIRIRRTFVSESMGMDVAEAVSLFCMKRVLRSIILRVMK